MANDKKLLRITAILEVASEEEARELGEALGLALKVVAIGEGKPSSVKVDYLDPTSGSKSGTVDRTAN